MTPYADLTEQQAGAIRALADRIGDESSAAIDEALFAARVDPQAKKPSVCVFAAANSASACAPSARRNQRISEMPQLMASKWVSITSSSIRTRARSRS